MNASLTPEIAAELVLAELLLEHDDHLVELERIRPALTPAAWVGVCQSLEVCPDHFCDAAICADDDADCAAGGRSAAPLLGGVACTAFGRGCGGTVVDGVCGSCGAVRSVGES